MTGALLMWQVAEMFADAALPLDVTAEIENYLAKSSKPLAVCTDDR